MFHLFLGTSQFLPAAKLSGLREHFTVWSCLSSFVASLSCWSTRLPWKVDFLGKLTSQKVDLLGKLTSQKLTFWESCLPKKVDFPGNLSSQESCFPRKVYFPGKWTSFPGKWTSWKSWPGKFDFPGNLSSWERQLSRKDYFPGKLNSPESSSEESWIAGKADFPGNFIFWEKDFRKVGFSGLPGKVGLLWKVTSQNRWLLRGKLRHVSSRKSWLPGKSDI